MEKVCKPKESLQYFSPDHLQDFDFLKISAVKEGNNMNPELELELKERTNPEAGLGVKERTTPKLRSGVKKQTNPEAGSGVKKQTNSKAGSGIKETRNRDLFGVGVNIGDTGSDYSPVLCTLTECRMQDVEKCKPRECKEETKCKNMTRTNCFDKPCKHGFPPRCQLEQFTETEIVCSTSMELVQGNCSKTMCRTDLVQEEREVPKEDCKEKLISRPREDTVEECRETVEMVCEEEKTQDGFIALGSSISYAQVGNLKR